jgi:hypothetical protein
MGLLSIGLDSERLKSDELLSDEQIREYLACLLDRTIPVESSIMDSLLIFLCEDAHHGKTVRNRSLSQLLLCPTCEVELFRAIKDYSKQIYQTTVSKGENSIASAIYYAAIAGAIVHHGVKISEHSWQTLATAFQELRTKPWMISELEELLEKAGNFCKTELQ